MAQSCRSTSGASGHYASLLPPSPRQALRRPAAGPQPARPRSPRQGLQGRPTPLHRAACVGGGERESVCSNHKAAPAPARLPVPGPAPAGKRQLQGRPAPAPPLLPPPAPSPQDALGAPSVASNPPPPLLLPPSSPPKPPVRLLGHQKFTFLSRTFDHVSYTAARAGCLMNRQECRTAGADPAADAASGGMLYRQTARRPAGVAVNGAAAAAHARAVGR